MKALSCNSERLASSSAARTDEWEYPEDIEMYGLFILRLVEDLPAEESELEVLLGKNSEAMRRGVVIHEKRKASTIHKKMKFPFLPISPSAYYIVRIAIY